MPWEFRPQIKLNTQSFVCDIHTGATKDVFYSFYKFELELIELRDFSLNFTLFFAYFRIEQ